MVLRRFTAEKRAVECIQVREQRHLLKHASGASGPERIPGRHAARQPPSPHFVEGVCCEPRRSAEGKLLLKVLRSAFVGLALGMCSASSWQALGRFSAVFGARVVSRRQFAF